MNRQGKPRGVSLLLVGAIGFLLGMQELAAQTTAGGASTEVAESPPRRLIVATKESPPFAFQRVDGSWTGISIELWRIIAEDLGLVYGFREMEMGPMIDSVEAGEVDVAIAAISINSDRDRRVDFSHAYFTTGLGIAVPARRTISIWHTVRRLLTTRLFEILGILALAAIAAGVIFWRLERRRNEGLFGGRKRQGVGMGIWWATIILLGHKGIMPATTAARGLAVVVMLASTIAVSTLTGVLASAITLSQLGPVIQHPDDLRHLQTATVEASTSVEYLKDRRLRFRTYGSVHEALTRLVAGDADAVVYDVALLKYRGNSDFASSVDILPQSFTSQQYAIAMPPQSELRKSVNQSLLRVTASDEWADILYRYLGE